MCQLKGEFCLPDVPMHEKGGREKNWVGLESGVNAVAVFHYRRKTLKLIRERIVLSALGQLTC